MTQEERETLLEMPAVRELLREEREACAAVADRFGQVDDEDAGRESAWVGREIAAAIRGTTAP